MQRVGIVANGQQGSATSRVQEAGFRIVLGPASPAGPCKQQRRQAFRVRGRNNARDNRLRSAALPVKQSTLTFNPRPDHSSRALTLTLTSVHPHTLVTTFCRRLGSTVCTHLFLSPHSSHVKHVCACGSSSIRSPKCCMYLSATTDAHGRFISSAPLCYTNVTPMSHQRVAKRAHWQCVRQPQGAAQTHSLLCLLSSTSAFHVKAEYVPGSSGSSRLSHSISAACCILPQAVEPTLETDTESDSLCRLRTSSAACSATATSKHRLTATDEQTQRKAAHIHKAVPHIQPRTRTSPVCKSTMPENHRQWGCEAVIWHGEGTGRVRGMPCKDECLGTKSLHAKLDPKWDKRRHQQSGMWARYVKIGAGRPSSF